MPEKMKLIVSYDLEGLKVFINLVAIQMLKVFERKQNNQNYFFEKLSIEIHLKITV